MKVQVGYFFFFTLYRPRHRCFPMFIVFMLSYANRLRTLDPYQRTDMTVASIFSFNSQKKSKEAYFRKCQTLQQLVDDLCFSGVAKCLDLTISSGFLKNVHSLLILAFNSDVTCDRIASPASPRISQQ